MPKITKPIPSHPYHTQSDAALQWLIKDAREAAEAMRGHDDRAEAKYLDQINDACTVLGYRIAIAVNRKEA